MKIQTKETHYYLLTAGNCLVVVGACLCLFGAELGSKALQFFGLALFLLGCGLNGTVIFLIL